MINCNPETVSTDYDTSDRLYFEPLTAEDVLAVCAQEKPGGRDRPVRRPDAAEAGPDAGRGGRAAARHPGRRDRPGRGPRPVRRPAATGSGSSTRPTAPRSRPTRPALIAEEVGFPLLVRPSFVLGGRAMEICYSTEDLAAYLKAHVKADQEHPLLLDRFLENAIEVDVDALGDGERGLRRRDHAARRGGRGPLRRLRLRDPAAQPRRGDARGDPRHRPSGSPWSSA